MLKIIALALAPLSDSMSAKFFLAMVNGLTACSLAYSHMRISQFMHAIFLSTYFLESCAPGKLYQNLGIISRERRLYQKYLWVHETPVRGKVYSFNEDAIRKAERNYGFFALMTNGIKDPVETLRIYRLKDLIEKSFSNLKERLSMRGISVASEENFEGKLFVQFIALQLMPYTKSRWMKMACLRLNNAVTA